MCARSVSLFLHFMLCSYAAASLLCAGWLANITFKKSITEDDVEMVQKIILLLRRRRPRSLACTKRKHFYRKERWVSVFGLCAWKVHRILSQRRNLNWNNRYVHRIQNNIRTEVRFETNEEEEIHCYVTVILMKRSLLSKSAAAVSFSSKNNVNR